MTTPRISGTPALQDDRLHGRVGGTEANATLLTTESHHRDLAIDGRHNLSSTTGSVNGGEHIDIQLLPAQAGVQQDPLLER